MSRSQFTFRVTLILAFYSLIAAATLLIKYSNPEKDDPIYAVFKDLAVLVVAIPAAYLVSCFNRWSAHTLALRTLWPSLVKAFHGARAYTLTANRTQEEYEKVMLALSIAIDEIRGHFRSLDEGKRAIGKHPFWSLKQIRDEIELLGFGAKATPRRATRTRRLIDKRWELFRLKLLKEFERANPDHAELRRPK